jgi:hypothetical protein
MMCFGAVMLAVQLVDFFILQDIALAHKTAIVCQFLAPKKVTTPYHSLTVQMYRRQTVFCSQS